MVTANITLTLIVLFICAGLFVYLNVEGFDATGNISASASDMPSVPALPQLSTADIVQLLRPEIEAIISSTPVKVDINDIYVQLKPKILELIHSSQLTIDPIEFVKTIKPELIKIIEESMPKPVTTYSASASGSQASCASASAAPASVAPAPSPALEQGVAYATAAPGCKPFNINEWIRKDSIPCYGCTLPA